MQSDKTTAEYSIISQSILKLQAFCGYFLKLVIFKNDNHKIKFFQK